jgi:hypothetical protein
MSWDKMDKKVWNDSVVMQELEKEILSQLKKANVLQQVKELAGPVGQQAGQNLKTISDSLKSMTGNAAEDSETEADQVGEVLEIIIIDEEVEKKSKDEAGKEDEENEEDKKDEDDEEAQSQLTDILQHLSELLADQGDTSLAYKLERVIQEIKDGNLNE